MSKTYSGTITIGVEQPNFGPVVDSAQDAAEKLNKIAEGLNESQASSLNNLAGAAEKSAASQTSAFEAVAKARSRDAAAVEAEKNATVAAFEELGEVAEESVKRKVAALNAVAETVEATAKQTQAGVDAAQAEKAAIESASRARLESVDSWTRVSDAVASASAKVPRWAKALGATVDAQGLLVNSLGRCVAGLNKSQVAAGEWVDELGNVRDANGGFVDGLTKIQKALGFFKDEAGNVRDRLGEIVVAAKKATDATGELESALPTDLFDGLVEGLGGAAQWFSQVGTVLTTLDGEASTAARTLSAVAAGVENFAQGFQSGKAILKFWGDFQKATEKATVAQALLQAASGNALAILGGAALAGVAAWTAWESSSADATKNVDAASDAFEELRKRAKAAGVEIKNAADAAKFGFGEALGAKSYAEEKANVERLDREIAEQQKRADAEAARNSATIGTGGMGAGGAGAYMDYSEAERLQALQAERAAANARMVEAQEAMIDAAVEASKTEVQKLEAEKKDYEAILEQLDGARGSAEVRAKIEALDAEIEKAKEAESTAAAKEAEEAKRAADAEAKRAEEAQKAAEAAAQKAREDALKASGIADFAPTQEKTPLDLTDATAVAAKYAEWAAAVDGTTVTVEDVAQATGELNRQALAALDAEANFAAKLAELEPPKTLEEEVAASLQKYADALEVGAMTQEEYNERKAQADALLLAAQNREAEEAEASAAQKREATRAELGVDALLESLKTPAEKLTERLEKIDKAFEDKAITQDERQKLEAAARREFGPQDDADDAKGAAKELASAARDFSASAQKSGESLAAKLNAAEMGSSALYSMQVGAAKNYQTKALDYAARQTTFAERSLRELGQIRQAFAANAIPVWRG
ncbi:MAG: hypothetical protein IKK39_11975 [Thermoguttaceae bacterium]|nr:hypothetical protein [Thermoguttaceae bacterium]MBR4104765.1 hypothetical protein [Thermoguttaceae bacterium]